jgi:hypothetical protein
MHGGTFERRSPPSTGDRLTEKQGTNFPSSRRLKHMSDAEKDARTHAGHDAGVDAQFGGLTPSEAAQKRWANERARQAFADTGNAGEVATDGDIVRTLRRRAAQGDVNAARELREWRTVEAQALQGDAWMEVLTPRERRFVRRVIQRALKRAGEPVTPGR